MSTVDAAGTAIDERFLTPGEVAELFRVDPKTASRWAHQRKMGSIKSPGGRWLFPESAVRRALASPSPQDVEPGIPS